MGKHGQPFTFAADETQLLFIQPFRHRTLSVGHSDLPESGLKLSHTWA